MNQSIVLTTSLDENITMLKKLFQPDTTVKMRLIQNPRQKKLRCCILFVDGLVNNVLVNQYIIEPLVQTEVSLRHEDPLDTICTQVLFTNDIIKMEDPNKLISELLSGNTILLLDGYSTGLSLSTRGWVMRSVAEPAAEKVLSGPREGFTEALIINLSLLRRKICNPSLKFEFMTTGKQSQTKLALAYMDGIADPTLIDKLRKKVKKISIDGILDTNYIEELIKDAPYSPFKTTGSTERPDIVAAKLLEGRIALFVDGTPVVLTAPFFFIEYFQSNDDYYSSFYAGTFGRWLRILGFIMTLSLPAIYLSLVTFHQELLPTRFLLNLWEARNGLPFPTLFEMFILILAFELIREGGAKVPANFGQTLSIVGGLVLGQAAVDAKLVSIPVVIIIAFTGVTGLMIPQLKSPVILIRLFWLLLASVLGFPGYMLGVILLLLHLSGLTTFDLPYCSSLSGTFKQECQDTLIRAPWSKMIWRPSLIAPSNRRRQKPGGDDINA